MIQENIPGSKIQLKQKKENDIQFEIYSSANWNPHIARKNTGAYMRTAVKGPSKPVTSGHLPQEMVFTRIQTQLQAAIYKIDKDAPCANKKILPCLYCISETHC